MRGRGAVQWTRCRVGLNSSAADKVVLVGQSVNRSRQCSSLSSLSLVWVSKPDSGPGGQWVHSSCWSIHTYHTTPHHRQSSTPILKVPCWALGSTRGAQPRDLGHCVAIKTTAGKVSVCSRDCSHREGFLRRLKRDGAIQRSTAPQESTGIPINTRHTAVGDVSQTQHRGAPGAGHSTEGQRRVRKTGTRGRCSRVDQTRQPATDKGRSTQPTKAARMGGMPAGAEEAQG